MQAARCPECSDTNADPVRCTGRGGLLGPKLFKVVKCQSGGTQYNAKTGQLNTKPIIVFTIVGLALGVGFVILETSVA